MSAVGPGAAKKSSGMGATSDSGAFTAAPNLASLWLIGTYHGNRFVHRLAEGICRVGRDPSSDLTLPSQTVSRNHAEVRLVGAREARVVDLGSRNGTKVNGQRLEPNAPKIVRVGDSIEFGSVPLDVCDASPDTSPLFALDSEIEQSVYLPREKTGSAELGNFFDVQILKLLTEAGQFLVLPGAPEETFDRILELVDRAIPANRILLLLCDETGTPVQRAARTHGGRATQPIMMSRTMVASVFQDGASLLTGDAQTDVRFREQMSIVAQDIRSAMAVPLVHGSEILGALYVDSADAARSYKEQDLRILTLLGQMLGAKIANARLLQAAQERERLRHEIDTARTIQQRLLPQSYPAVAGYELVAWQESCEEVGGDLYDFGELPEGCWQVCLGDVSGKGVGAALLMSSVLGTIRALRGDPLPVARLVSRLDRHLLQTTEPMHYATLFLGDLNPSTHHFEYVNAGHPAARLIEATGEVRSLGPTDVPVGLVDRPGVTFEREALEIPPGGTLVIVSDGITEAAQSFEDEMFGEKALDEVLATCAGLSAAEVATKLRDALLAFLAGAPATDDATLVVVRRVGK